MSPAVNARRQRDVRCEWWTCGVKAHRDVEHAARPIECLEEGDVADEAEKRRLENAVVEHRLACACEGSRHQDVYVCRALGSEARGASSVRGR